MQRQIELLLRAVELVKRGGLIVYSTCTFAPEENEISDQQIVKPTEQY